VLVPLMLQTATTLPARLLALPSGTLVGLVNRRLPIVAQAAMAVDVTARHADRRRPGHP